MLGILKLYHLFKGNVVNNSLGVIPHSITPILSSSNFTLANTNKYSKDQQNDAMSKALIHVFGMEKDGKIAKEKACNVVKSLGLEKEDEEELSFDILEEELEVGEVFKVEVEDVNEENGLLLQQVFKVFDEDGDGFIDAKEIKRVFKCLGLDNGWNMNEIEKMIKVVDVNLDGKVDFHEFEMMMGHN